MGEIRGRVIKEYVKRTPGQSHSGVGLRLGGGDRGSREGGGGKVEITVLEQQ